MPATALPTAWPLYRHDDLFREPAYEDGQPYAQDDQDEEE